MGWMAGGRANGRSGRRKRNPGLSPDDKPGPQGRGRRVNVRMRSFAHSRAHPHPHTWANARPPTRALIRPPTPPGSRTRTRHTRTGESRAWQARQKAALPATSSSSDLVSSTMGRSPPSSTVLSRHFSSPLRSACAAAAAAAAASARRGVGASASCGGVAGGEPGRPRCCACGV